MSELWIIGVVLGVPPWGMLKKELLLVQLLGIAILIINWAVK